MSGKERDPRPFKSPFPGYVQTFPRAEHQTQHMPTHSGERPYPCDYPGCTSKFARKDELHRHRRLMHYEAALAENDQVVYKSHSHRQSEQFSGRTNTPSGTRHDDPYYSKHPYSSSHHAQLHPRPSTSMNYYSSSGYGRHHPHEPSRVVQPSSQRPSPGGGGGNALFTPPPPANPGRQPLPLHYRSPTKGSSNTPITLPPLESDHNGYATDSGRRSRPARAAP